MKNFIKIVQCGGFQDPYPPEQMAELLKEAVDGQVKLVEKRRLLHGTSGGESTNKQFNSATNMPPEESQLIQATDELF